MRILTLKEIIEAIYKKQGKNFLHNTERDVDFFLHKPDEKSKRGVLYPIREDGLSEGQYSSIRNAGVLKRNSHFPRKDFKRRITEISNSGNAWIKEYVMYLKNHDNSPINEMNDSIKNYINETINDHSITMPDSLRSYLKNPYIAYDYDDDEYADWIRLAWLIIFSIVQSELIQELSSLWVLPDEYTLNRCFTDNYNFSVYSSSAYPREIIDVQLGDDGILNLYINFMPHMDVETTPEWASLVMWLPNGPLDYSSYSGELSFDIRAISGISKISLELQNADNTGGHKYYLPYTIDNEWKTIYEEFSKKTVSLHILKSFGALCFVIHPDSFSSRDRQAHIQIKNICIQ